jgi:hypothetical protein
LLITATTYPLQVDLGLNNDIRSSILTMALFATEVNEREALKSRMLPHMTLSKGDQSSLTAAPTAAPPHLDARERANLRFQVQGNAM